MPDGRTLHAFVTDERAAEADFVIVLYNPKSKKRHWRRFRRRVSQREEDLNQSDTISITMVNPLNDDGSTDVILDVVELPQRTRRIQPRARQVADELFQLRLVRFPRQRHATHVGMNLEVLVHYPVGPSGAVHGFLAEAFEGQPAFLDGLQQALVWYRARQCHHAGDHHRRGAGTEPGD